MSNNVKKEYLEPKYNRSEFTCLTCNQVSRHDSYNLYSYGTSFNISKIESNFSFSLDEIKKVNLIYVEENLAIYLVVKICENCKSRTYWEIQLPNIAHINKEQLNSNRLYWPLEKELANEEKKDILLFPNISTITEIPNEDLNEIEKQWFNEAKDIFDKSPKAAGALLRIVLESLIKRCYPNNCESDDRRKLYNVLKENENDIRIKFGDHIWKWCNLARLVGNESAHPIAGKIDDNDGKEIVGSYFKWINIIADNILTQPKRHEALLIEENSNLNK